MDEPITIRPGTAADIEAILRVHRASVEVLCRGHYNPEQIVSWLEGRPPEEIYLPSIESGRLDVAEQDGRVIAFVEWEDAEITKLFIVPEAAGRGLGKSLLENAILMIRRIHSGPIRIEATLNAIGFYRKMGFVEMGEAFFSRARGGVPLEVIRMELR